MRISACVITKNEEKNLPTCLNSMRSIVSEMIVVDTGSTDQTVAVAESLGAKVFHFTWINDFSQAKNYAISKATGDWIIFLDADEYFTDESVPLIPLVIKEANENDCDIIVSLLCNIDISTKQTINTVHHSRIFRNHSEIRYEGAIHERLMKSGKAPRGLMASEGLAIIHTGYSSDIEISKRKSERNIKLLAAEFEKSPQSGELCFYLAESHMAAREFEQALEYAYRSADLDNCTLLGVKQKNYLNIITCMIHLNKEKNEIKQWINKGIEGFPDYPDFYLLLADLLTQECRYQDALEAFSVGIKFIDNALKSQSAAPHQAPKILTLMGELQHKIGQNHDAVKHFVSALNIDKFHYAALIQLLKLLTRFESINDTKKFLNKMYDISNKKDLLYLTRACLEVKNHLLGGYYLSLFSEQDFLLMAEENAEYRLLAGDFKHASTLFDKIYEEKQSTEAMIKALCALFLSGDSATLLEHLQKYKSVESKEIEEGLTSLTDAECLLFISCLIKLQKVDKAMELKHLYEGKNIILDVANLLYDNEKFKEAEVLYAELIAKKNFEEKSRAILLSKQGECLWRIGKYEVAKKLGYEARNLNSQEYQSHSLLMSVTSETGEINELTEIVREAIGQFPDSAFLQSVQAVINNQIENNHQTISY
ncbi:glycosyltransferase [Brevibacillus nitrificans]|uniref:Glycosyltransferase n=1 Tax=Brevibacillus nitrificans TaxID=651560 RepID=A0A3M8DRJ9_9BACL|nr:glycosyltransferase [Brevibacillus nitrificans]RNB90109.1 glycosyltransferase [Brevibacillus nitrificans]